VFDLLLVLVERHGHLLEKDELLQTIWRDAIVEEGNLTANISILRRTLGDDGNSARFIETVPKRGYRFVANVKELAIGNDGWAAAPQPGSGTVPVAETAEKSLSGNLFQRVVRYKAMGVLSLLLLLGLTLSSLYVPKLINRSSAQPFPLLESVALTRTGNATGVAISPDGQSVAYATESEGLWLKNLTAQTAQQLIPPVKAEYFGLSFSPDGRYLYFVWAEQHNDPLRALYRIPILGGTPARLLTDIDWAPGFSPDSTRIVFHRLSTNMNESYLMIANADGSGVYRLATRPASQRFRFHAWSPDGTVIASAAGTGELGGAQQVLLEVRVADGVEKTIPGQKWRSIGSPCWLADGSGLLVLANDAAGNSGLWRVSWPDGAAHKLTNDPDNYNQLSITADARTLAVAKVSLQAKIWAAPVQGRHVTREGHPLTTGLGGYLSVAWLPDGRILYKAIAQHVIKFDLWVMNADGTGRRQLTEAGTHWENSIAPDGRYIVFSSDRAGRMNIWRMNSDGDNPKQLTTGDGERMPVCSADSQWVIYTSLADWSLWKLPIEGGAPVRIPTQGQARGAAVSRDGQWLAYLTREPQPGGIHRYRIVVMPFAGGPPLRTFDFPPCDSHELLLRWTPDSQALTYIIERSGVSNIWAQPMAGGAPVPLTDFKAEQIFDFGWSHDGTQLICTRGLWAKDVFLLKSLKE
jgi:Tol biopolymer transport system component/DNA-binding winged helix-turn-helix (wHTH) protein